MKRFITWVKHNDTELILCLTIVMSLASFVYWYQEGLITAYGDSRAHLNIARRVVDSLTPGIAQLGGTWLPLLHVLMLPTIWNDFMWKSGLSGSVVNMIAYIVSMTVFYKLVYAVTKKRITAFLGYLALALNINILYFQATPMTEMLFISTLIISLYFLYRWQETSQIVDLITAGIFIMLSSMNRYEGWGVAVASVVLVGIVSLVKYGKSKAEANFLLFGMIAGFGMIMWIVWQIAIFGHPFDFLRNDFAAGVNTARDIAAGAVPTYKNLPVSILTEIYASFHTSGVIITVLGFLGIVIYLLHKNGRLFHAKATILLIGIVPFLFEILVVYRGNVPVYVPEIRIDREIPPFFNVRYALYFLPVLVVFFLLYVRKWYLQVAALVLLTINNILLIPNRDISKILAFQDWGNLAPRENLEAQAWFRENYDTGLILVSVSSSDAFINKVDIPMKTFISEGSGKYWRESLQKPNRYVRWVIIQDSGRDLLVRQLNTEDLRRRFTLMEKKGGYRFYKIKEEPLIKI